MMRANAFKKFVGAAAVVGVLCVGAFVVGCSDDDDKEQCVDQSVAVPSADFCNSTYVQFSTNLKNPTAEYTFRDGMCYVTICGEL